MDKSLYARSNLYECTVVSDYDNLALNVVANLQVCIECIPWVRSELLQTKSDALLLVIEVEDNDIDLLVESNNLVWIAYAAPREVCDVDESVNTTEVNEYTVRGDVLDCTLEDLTLLKLADDFFLLCLQLSLDEGLVRNNNVTELLVDLDNLELHCLAYEYIVVTYRMNVNLASWQECLDTEYVNDHTALSAALDVTLDNFLVVQSSVDTLPALAETSLLVRKKQLTLLVFLVLNVHLYCVANLQIWIVAEFACGDDTVAFVTNVYDNLFLVDRDYSTVNNLMLAYLVECLVISFLQIFFADIYITSVLKLVPVEVCQRLYVLKICHKNK